MTSRAFIPGRLLHCAACLLLLGPAVCFAKPRPYAPTQASDRGPDQLRTLSRDELDIVKVLTAQEKAWNRGDIDAFATGYKNTPDLIFIGRQISHGYTQMLADYHRDYPNKDAMGKLSFSDLEPRVLDEHFAIMLGHYRLDRSKKAGGAADGFFSLVLEKTDKGWKIIVDHTT